MTVTQIVKRDGKVVAFERERVENAIYAAARAAGNGVGRPWAETLSWAVVALLNERVDGTGRVPHVEEIQDLVEEVLIKSGNPRVAKAYILYRRQRADARATKRMLLDSEKLVEDYLQRADWRVNENSNMNYSLQGLNFYLASSIAARYWLHRIYPPEVQAAHINGDLHVHDLGMLSVYCCGWDLQDLLVQGFGGVTAKVESAPPRHLRTALGQLVNFFYTLQGESAGAVAVSNFDTLLAPFVRYDGLAYDQVKQAMQEFVFNINVPTRVGFQCVSEDTEILGADGWVRHDQVHVGDRIATFNVQEGRIEYLPVQRVFVRQYQGTMYRLHNAATDQLISPRHRVVRRDPDTDAYVLEPIETALAADAPLVVPLASSERTRASLATDTVISSVQEVPYEGVIWCPNTANETVVARRAGQVFITGNTPFTNLTMDLVPPSTLADEPVIIGGEVQDAAYGEFRAEMDMINRAFAEVMLAGDAKGRVFTFPIPTYNIGPDFDWENPNLAPLWDITAKYGVPYFANFINSDMKPEDARSMCCRLRLDNRELRQRLGGLFAAAPLTGSVGVVTMNLPRLGYRSRNERDFLVNLERLMEIARTSLEIKRKMLETLTARGLYPYSRHFLRHVEGRTGAYWSNHFSTIGLNGMHEAALNLLGVGIDHPDGKAFAVRVLNFMRQVLARFQDETSHLYNLEATPAEGATYRLARVDRERFPDIVAAGTATTPYYTNSTHLPVNFSDDLFAVLDHQDDLQTLYTGGTVLHIFLGERLDDGRQARRLVRTVAENYRLPYYTLSPTFSVCPVHGYIAGAHEYCPYEHTDEELRRFGRPV